MVRAYMRKRLSTPEAIEDLTQQTLLRIHAYRASCSGSFDGWMYAVARNVLYDHLGDRAAESIEREVEEGDAELSATQEAKLLLQEALAGLSEESQRAIHLTKLEGFDLREAAAEENISESAMKVRVHRAMKKLKDRLWVDS